MLPLRIHPAWALFVGLLAPALNASAADFIVTRHDDPSPASCLPGNCTLREAVQAAAAQPGPHRILLPGGYIGLELGVLEIGTEVLIEGNASLISRITASGPQPLLRVVEGGQATLNTVMLYSNASTLIEVTGNASLHLERISAPDSHRNIVVGQVAHANLTVVDSYLRNLIVCYQLAGQCHVERSRIGSLIAGGADSAVDTQLRHATVMGTPFVHPLLSGVIVNGTAPLSIEHSEIRNSLRPLALYQSGAAGSAPRVNVRRTRFLENHGPLRGSRKGVVEMDEVLIWGHNVDPDSGLGSDYVQAPSVLLADEGPYWQVKRSAIYYNFGVAADGRTMLLNPGARVVLDNIYFEHNTRRDGLAHGTSDGIGVYAGPGEPPRLLLLHTTLLRSNIMQPGGTGSVLGVRGPSALVRSDNSIIIGQCTFLSGATGVAGRGNVTSESACGLDPGINITQVPPAHMNLEDRGYWGGFTPSRPPTSFSTAVGVASPDYCTETDQRGALRPGDGIGCDAGSVQHDVEMPMFADGFE